MAITRAGTKTTIVGYKLSSTATGGGTAFQGQRGYLADTSITGSAEENVTHTGTCDGNCKVFIDGGNRDSLEDTTQNFNNQVHSGFFLENTTTGSFVAGSGHDNAGDNIRCIGDAFNPGDTYRIHGYCKAAPTLYTQSYQWNILHIDGGTGINQVRLIRCITDVAGEVRFWVNLPWETTPDNTSTYKVYWGPHDVVYANAAAGTIHFERDGLLPIWVQINDELEWGNTGGTATGFGWADLLLTTRSDHFSGASFDPVNESYSNVNFRYGEFDPIKESVSVISLGGAPAIFRNIKSEGYSGGAWTDKVGHLANRYNYGAFKYGEAADLGILKESYFADRTGSDRSFGNVLTQAPQSISSEADYLSWVGGGNWQEPFAGYGNASSNSYTLRGLGAPQIQPPIEGRGLAWAGGNTGDNGTFFTWIEDCDFGITDNYVDSSGRTIDFFKFDWYAGGFNYQIFLVKTLNITVTDKQSGIPIQDATITITDRLGNTISYEDTGLLIEESVNTSELLIDVSGVAGVSVGDTIRVDTEFMDVDIITPDTQDRLTVTREARMPTLFPALPHEDAVAGFDPKIYRMTSLTTDASGQIPEQKLFAGSLIWRGGGTAYASRVSRLGINYTCILDHTAAVANQPPNATYWSVSAGLPGDHLPWTEGKRYAVGNVGFRDKSFADLIPFSVKIQKPGYETETVTVNPTFDSRGEVIDAKFKRRRFIETRSREGGRQVPKSGTIADVGKAYGGVSVFGNTTQTVINSIGVKEQFLGFDTNEIKTNVTPDHTNDHITADYTGDYEVSAKIISSTPSTPLVINFSLYKNNGATLIVEFPKNHVSTNSKGEFTLFRQVTLTAGDTVELWVENPTSTTNVLIADCVMTVTKIG